MNNYCFGYARSGNHWIKNILGEFGIDLKIRHHHPYDGFKFDKSVYISRNYNDIVASSKRYWGNVPNVLSKWGIGNYRNHIKAWKNQPNVYYVKYEDLIENPIAGFLKILLFFDVKPSVPGILRALDKYKHQNNMRQALREKWNINNNYKGVKEYGKQSNHNN